MKTQYNVYFTSMKISWMFGTHTHTLYSHGANNNWKKAPSRIVFCLIMLIYSDHSLNLNEKYWKRLFVFLLFNNLILNLRTFFSTSLWDEKGNENALMWSTIKVLAFYLAKSDDDYRENTFKFLKRTWFKLKSAWINNSYNYFREG